MGPLRFLKPKPALSEQEINAGLKWNIWESVASSAMVSIAGGGIMTAYALALGANAFQIGILSAIPSITQLFQIPAVLLIERVRRRKLIVFITKLITQLFWIPVALIPVWIGVPSIAAITALMAIMFFRYSIIAVVSCGLNPWIRDLIPQQTMGSFFARRQTVVSIVTAVFSMGGALVLDYWRGSVVAETGVLGYTYVILFAAAIFGISSMFFLSLVPEPMMQPVPGPKPTIIQTLTLPLRDSNFRKLMQFLFLWSFSSSLAAPFFAVTMLQRLGLPLTWVMGLSVISQFFNIIFLKVWGRFTDRFGSKVVISLCTSLYVLVIFGWIFTTMPERYFLTIPLLVLLHIFSGIASAGLSISISTIGLKMAPRDQATPYLTATSLASSLGSGIGPVLGGVLGGFFATRQLALVFSWFDPARSIELPTFSMIGFDFVFGISVILGLVTLGLLTLVREKDEISREVVLESLVAPMREFARPLSSVPPISFVSNVPFTRLKSMPVPGLDVALGVTAYQIAQMARIATAAAIHGNRITRSLAKSLQKEMRNIWKSRKELKTHGVAVTREATRGAIHAVAEQPLDVSKKADSIVKNVINASTQAGISPEDAIRGASQGAVRGAAETGTDLAAVTRQTIKATRKSAAQIGLSQESAVTEAIEGAIEAAETISPEAAEEVKKSLP